MNDTELIFFISLAAVLSVVVIWLIIEHKNLKQKFDILSHDNERNNKDIAGLCSAAVSVDNSILDSQYQLKNIVEKLISFEQEEKPTVQPYHYAIERVKQGANADELVKLCGLSLDEAALLIKLHGGTEM